jgi:hypothetical protein
MGRVTSLEKTLTSREWQPATTSLVESELDRAGATTSSLGRNTMTLRISFILSLLAAVATAFAATWMNRLYEDAFQGVPLPTISNIVLWKCGILHWAAVPLLCAILYALGERGGARRQRYAEGIMVIGTASTILFMIGSVLPLTSVTFSLKGA